MRNEKVSTNISIHILSMCHASKSMKIIKAEIFSLLTNNSLEAQFGLDNGDNSFDFGLVLQNELCLTNFKLRDTNETVVIVSGCNFVHSYEILFPALFLKKIKISMPNLPD